MIFYTVLIILTIITTTFNTFVYDKSILNWIIDVILYSGLWGFVYILNKEIYKW